ncbi:hypothetical protein Mgra_00001066 [Meloidogyne graminicola]|uniref:Uncharacterized protein n=1 Tax=Meloidogyne graminicola TaxID=189291 RepID=A0A8T0A271_9BILA|nr:hypothetical protein Mgra_00001066 [Meloidogyne graminicola]
MKSIIVNNNFWKKKAMFINILAIFIVVLLVLIEQIKTEGVVGISEGSANNERKVLSTRVSMAKTTEPSANETKINETVQVEMLMVNNNGQKIDCRLI